MFSDEPRAPVVAIILPAFVSSRDWSAVDPALSLALPSSLTIYASKASAGFIPLVSLRVPFSY